MIVYEIVEDVEIYKAVFLLDQKRDMVDQLQGAFDCQSKIDTWVPPRVFKGEPELANGNFSYLEPGVMVLDEKSITVLNDVIFDSGELLKLQLNGEINYIFNITKCIDSLDQSNTEWRLSSTSGVKLWITKYAFISERLTEGTVFKIPETITAAKYYCNTYPPTTEGFKELVEKHKLTGLQFVEIYRD